MKPKDEITDPIEAVLKYFDRIPHYLGEFDRFLNNFLKSIAYNTLMVVFLLYTAFTLTLIISPLLIDSPNPNVREIGSLTYISVALLNACHQLPHRSFIISGIPQAVCSRDIGIYLGAILGVLLPLYAKKLPPILKSIKILLLATAPIALDGFTQTIFAWRESSNILRFTTGLIFGFGVLSYITLKLFHAYLELRPTVLRKQNLVVTFFVTIMLLYMFISDVVPEYSINYITRQDALQIALDDCNQTKQNANVFYVPPKAPVSLQFDLFVGRYGDFVLQDVKRSAWAEKQLNFTTLLWNQTAFNETDVPEHMNGVWVVVLSDQEDSSGRRVYSSLEGEYYYIDAVSGTLIEKKNH